MQVDVVGRMTLVCVGISYASGRGHGCSVDDAMRREHRPSPESRVGREAPSLSQPARGIRGRYIHEHRGEHWVAHRWHEHDGRYRFENGHWERG
jgi:hypothetical protein